MIQIKIWLQEFFQNISQLQTSLFQRFVLSLVRQEVHFDTSITLYCTVFMAVAFYIAWVK